MLKDLRCNNTEEHDPHPHVVKVRQECSGVLPCGERIHEPHEMQVEEKRWCFGICNCGIGALHGPGRHK